MDEKDISIFKQLVNQRDITQFDPLCINEEKYRKGRNVWPLNNPMGCFVENRVSQSPNEIKQKYQEYTTQVWNRKSRCEKIFTLLTALPSHIYRYYFSSIDYKQYYRSLYHFVSKIKTT